MCGWMSGEPAASNRIQVETLKEALRRHLLHQPPHLATWHTSRSRRPAPQPPRAQNWLLRQSGSNVLRDFTSCAPSTTSHQTARKNTPASIHCGLQRDHARIDINPPCCGSKESTRNTAALRRHRRFLRCTPTGILPGFLPGLRARPTHSQLGRSPIVLCLEPRGIHMPCVHGRQTLN